MLDGFLTGRIMIVYIMDDADIITIMENEASGSFAGVPGTFTYEATCP